MYDTQNKNGMDAQPLEIPDNDTHEGGGLDTEDAMTPVMGMVHASGAPKPGQASPSFQTVTTCRHIFANFITRGHSILADNHPRRSNCIQQHSIWRTCTCW